MFVHYLLFFLLLKECLLIDLCEKSENCKECIRNPNVCVWCAAKAFNRTRCIPRSSYEADWCPESVPVNELSNSIMIESNENKQIKPLKYEMKLRIGEPQKFNFTYDFKDNPVDVYFLLDASAMMGTKIKNIASKADGLYKTLETLTNDFTLGVGTFIDKNTWKENGKESYSFAHELSLTKDHQKFVTALESTPTGYNRDPPTGCLDAIAQAIVCDKLIGWREKSRKIIVVLTNNNYHDAGDGRVSGIFEPYDGQCYTDLKNKRYKRELTMDYPSVGMINKLVDHYKVTVLFLVESTVKSAYQSLSDVISGSYIDDWVNEPINPYDTTGQTLKKIYKQIIGNVTLNVDIKAKNIENVKIHLSPNCTKGNYDKNCLVKTDQSIKFEGSVEILNYDSADNVSVEFSVQGLAEKLSIDIDVISDCRCEGNEKSSGYCNGRPLECGQCLCDDGNSECNFEGSICSGHPCFCGICHCTYPYTGKYCECNSLDCEKITSGNGECVDGKCQCKDEWSGITCSCPKSNSTCKGNDNRVCNDYGFCLCGKCECHELSDWDPRQLDSLCALSPCADCHKKQCIKLSSHVLRFNNEDLNEYSRPYIKMNSSDSLEDPLDPSWNLCPELRMENGCYTTFAYKYQGGYGIELLIQKNKNCDENILKLGVIVSVTVILVGIGTLVVWKLMTKYHDRKEYMELMKQYNPDQGARTNKLYIDPCVTFKNPSYRADPITES
ncbi:integrin beta pat-3-like [Bombyx mandarina]|uniref:Integrin beta n=1 Tax=Bombyx mandarina TaxID=7092 RepID=A0A6J2K4B3_BOMMA|nr:integrin beta pat-3-like [Bombyx mandarina]